MWHTPYDLVLDFLAETRPGPAVEGALEAVARVRIPVGFALDALRSMSATMAEYEGRYGDIHRPEER